MESLYIEATKDTPEVNFDPGNDIFVISHRSLPENAIKFYEPIFSWFEKYQQAPNKNTNLDIKLDYFNTASSKQIVQFLSQLAKLNNKSKVVINWYYRDIDEDMLEIGQEYSKLINFEFNFIVY